MHANVQVEIRGPGHHERSELASRVVAVLVAAGREVVVEMDLRPRLAADIAAAIDSGATSVLLDGGSFYALASRQKPDQESGLRVVLLATADSLGLYDLQRVLSGEELKALEAAGVDVHNSSQPS